MSHTDTDTITDQPVPRFSYAFARDKGLLVLEQAADGYVVGNKNNLSGPDLVWAQV